MLLKLRNILSSHYFEGAALLLFGLIMLLWPLNAKKIICVLMGCILILLGAILIVSFLKKMGVGHPLELFGGLLSFALGIEMLARPSTFIVVVQVVMSITLIYSAILLFLQAYLLRNERGSLFVITVIFAVAALFFAVIMLIKPLEVARAFTQVKGASLILEGLAALFVIRTQTLGSDLV